MYIGGFEEINSGGFSKEFEKFVYFLMVMKFLIWDKYLL